jgi:CheY-like chemotaxis protein
MAAVSTKPKRILFVDDEPAFLETLATVIEQTSAELWEPFFAESAGKALSLLQDQPVDMVVLDVEMPVIDGLQFLSLVHRRHPNLAKVVLTGYATDQHRAACLSGGAELFLEKPRTAEDLRSILATLHELARWQPEDGFRGVLRRVGLQDIIQMECLSRHSVVLYVNTDSSHGEVFIRDGSIIHAQTGDLIGEAAFNRILALKGGEFDLRTFEEPGQESIEGQWEFLLMEAARQLDEDIESAAARAVEDDGKEVSLDSLPDMFSAMTRPVDPKAEPSEDAITVQAGELVEGLPISPVEDEKPNRVDEIVVCSPHGDVIYEWQCVDTEKRISFLEFLSQKSQQMGSKLNFGKFDRLEILTAKSKIVAQLQPDCGVLIRTSKQESADDGIPGLRMAS